ncbi:MAG: phosphatase PAP2 family protein [Bacteroidia bacterium]
MLEQLLAFDKSFFLAINNGMSNPFLDWLCPILRKQEVWYPFYAIFIFFLIKQYKTDSWKILLGIGLMVLASDQFSANLVKNTFQRIRPCNEPSLSGMVHHLINSCNGYSFISAHATNHFALAMFISLCFRTKKWLWVTTIIWAASIAFSQVYVGVHYPLDVITGSLVGILFGLSFAKYTLKFVGQNKQQLYNGK